MVTIKSTETKTELEEWGEARGDSADLCSANAVLGLSATPKYKQLGPS